MTPPRLSKPLPFSTVSTMSPVSCFWPCSPHAGRTFSLSITISRAVHILEVQSILPGDENTELREVKVAPSCGHLKYFTKSILRAYNYTKSQLSGARKSSSGLAFIVPLAAIFPGLRSTALFLYPALFVVFCTRGSWKLYFQTVLCDHQPLDCICHWGPQWALNLLFLGNSSCEREKRERCTCVLQCFQ